MPTLLKGAELDWRVDPQVLEAHTRINALKTLCGDPQSLAETLVGEEREPALVALEQWGPPLGVEVDLGDKALKPFTRTDAWRDWGKALKALAPQLKKIEDGKELGRMDSISAKLDGLAGPFPAELSAELRAAEREGEDALRTALLRADELPARWLVRDRLKW